MAGTRQNLTAGQTVVLGATGGQVILGPDVGPPNWHVTSIITQTNRPGLAPIPKIALYLDAIDPTNVLCVSYDGSFGQANGDLDLVRGQHIIAVWTGGQAGDVATLTVNGERWA